MPLPTPKKDEKKNDFISRCIEQITKDESDRFPSVEQRAAICYSQWNKEHPEDKKKKKNEYPFIRRLLKPKDEERHD